MNLDPVLQRFFDAASTLSLTREERSAARVALVGRISLLAPGLHLTAREHAEGKDTLLAHMRAYPLPSASRLSFVGFWESFSFLRVPAFALCFLLVLVGGGAFAAHAADDALPGDMLYSLKVGVIEPLQERMLRTPEQRAAWRVRTVERRIAEAKSLSDAGRLTGEHRLMLERRISVEIDTLEPAASPLLAPSGGGSDTDLAAQEVLSDSMEMIAFPEQGDASSDPEWGRLTQFVLARRSGLRHTDAASREERRGGNASQSSSSALPPPVPPVRVPAAGQEGSVSSSSPRPPVRFDVPGVSLGHTSRSRSRQSSQSFFFSSPSSSSSHSSSSLTPSLPASSSLLPSSPSSSPALDATGAPADESDKGKEFLEHIEEKRERIEEHLRDFREREEKKP